MVDLRLYVVLDMPGEQVGDLPAIAAKAAEGGATLFQLRAKTASTRAQIDAARAIHTAIGGRAPLLLNDRVDVALAAGAEGVHVGHGDISASEARAILGPSAIVGLTVHTAAEAADAPVEAIDYASIGGVFRTMTKTNPHPPIGVDGFRALAGDVHRRRPDLPVCAIAGITVEAVPALVAAGAAGVAVVSAVTAAVDPAAAVRQIRSAVEAARAGRSEAASA